MGAADLWGREDVVSLVRRFARHVCSGTRPPGGGNLQWEDVAQEASARFLTTARDRFAGRGTVRSYLYGLVRRTALELARGDSRRRAREERWAPEVVVELSHDVRIDVDRLLARLGMDCQEILQQVFLEEVPYHALARDLGLAESSVRSRVSRCLKTARGMVS